MSLYRCHPCQSLAVLAAALLLAGLALCQSDSKPRKIAVLVGVKAYNHADLPDLEFTENDVTDLGDLLRQAGYQVTLLTTTAGAKDARRKPTLANIRRELEAALKDVTKYDTVLIGLAGHGVQPGGAKTSYFCPSDAKPKDTKTLLSLGELIEQLNDSGVGVKLLLVDACRNDPDPGRGRGVDGSRIEALPKGVASLFSCSAGQRSFETPKAGGGHGIFFHFVLEGLRGQAAREGGEVTWSRLADYVQENVEKQAPVWINGAARQVPHEVKNIAGRSPVLVDLGKAGGTDVGKAERKDVPKSDTGKGGGTDSGTAKQEELSKTVAVDLGGGVTMEFLRIKAGKFLMGSPLGEKDRSDDEAQHEVEITRDFYLGKYTVTQQQYEALMGTNPSYFSAKGGGKEKVQGMDTSCFPVESVSWEDAVRYCDKLTEKYGRGGRKFRLPTEAEWEYACRGGTKTPYSFGSSCNGTEANCDGSNPYGTSTKGRYLERTCAVGSYRPNAWGLYDMHGNVWQWCQDWYGPYGDLGTKDPLKGEIKYQGYRVMRSGPWNSDARRCRAATRNWDSPENRSYDVGFRAAFRLD
jgi:formylglycine-generating enzyme required for sulfatase activity